MGALYDIENKNMHTAHPQVIKVIPHAVTLAMTKTIGLNAMHDP